jgi:hypothetical protein
MAKTTVINAGQHLNLDELMGDNIRPNGLGDGHFSLDTFSLIKLAANPREYKGHTLHDFYSVGGWTADGVGRKKYMGEMEQGPHAYMNGVGVMITEAPQPDEIAYLVAEGSTVVLKGTTYVVKYDKFFRDYSLAVAE